MKIIVVDDESLILDDEAEEIKRVFPNEEIRKFTDGEEAIEYTETIKESHQKVDYAFLDIKLRGMTGLELGKKIKERMPDVKILFCTAYSEYACEAYQMYAIGYLLKPIDSEKIMETLKRMDKDWKDEQNKSRKDIMVHTFGNFEVFLNGSPIRFEREKAKEVLAYLIDRRGAAATTSEIAGILWENEPYDSKVKNRTTSIISSLKKSLTDYGMQDIIIKTWNHIAVDTSKIRCDVYDFQNGDNHAINSYRGEYMTNYSWAEFTNASLTQDMINIANK